MHLIAVDTAFQLAPGPPRPLHGRGRPPPPAPPQPPVDPPRPIPPAPPVAPREPAVAPDARRRPSVRPQHGEGVGEHAADVARRAVHRRRPSSTGSRAGSGGRAPASGAGAAQRRRPARRPTGRCRGSRPVASVAGASAGAPAVEHGRLDRHLVGQHEQHGEGVLARRRTCSSSGQLHVGEHLVAVGDQPEQALVVVARPARRAPWRRTARTATPGPSPRTSPGSISMSIDGAVAGVGLGPGEAAGVGQLGGQRPQHRRRQPARRVRPERPARPAHRRVLQARRGRAARPSTARTATPRRCRRRRRRAPASGRSARRCAPRPCPRTPACGR